MHREGEGIPAVVIGAGVADEVDKLQPLRGRIARVTEVITCNRDGYGQSEPGPLPRDGARKAEALKVPKPAGRGRTQFLLQKAGVTRYILE